MILCLYECSIICCKALIYCKNGHQKKAEAREINLYPICTVPCLVFKDSPMQASCKTLKHIYALILWQNC